MPPCRLYACLERDANHIIKLQSSRGVKHDGRAFVLSYIGEGNEEEMAEEEEEEEE